MSTAQSQIKPPLSLAEPDAPAAAPVPPKKKRAKTVALALVGVAVTGALIGFLVTRGKESTDDAQIEGRIATVSSRVSGQVAKVLVFDNQAVKKGDVLVELDKRELEAKAAAARADLAAAKAQNAAAVAQLAMTERGASASLLQAKGSLVQAHAGVGGSHASVQQAHADVDAAQARKDQTAADWERAQSLFEQKTISRQQFDASKSAAEQAAAQLELAKARLLAASASESGSAGALTAAQARLSQASTVREQLDIARAAVGTTAARLQQAEAALQLAELNLEYATIRAPADGAVARRSVEEGQTVDPSRPLLALVETNEAWVVANFKEDQLGEMKPGQKVKLQIDAYGSRTFTGHVDSIAGAAGNRFALLPPDNASGNFIKVTQRVPVLVRFDGDTGVSMRPGLSANVTVYTR